MFGLAAMVVVLATNTGRADDERVPLDKLPKVASMAVKKRFPNLEIKAASKKTIGDHVLFEVTLKRNGKNTDVTITEAGVITLIEQELEFKDLPRAVARTFDEKYRKAKYEIVESVTKVENGKESLEYYEAKLMDQNKKTWEVEVLPDGKLKKATEIRSGMKD
jgi:hypothetical protein